MALQDIDPSMGPTVFIPNSITEDVYIQRVYDHWSEPLKHPHVWSDLEAGNSCHSRNKASRANYSHEDCNTFTHIGDAAIYDSRILHCGSANRSVNRPARILFYFTIRCEDQKSQQVDEGRGMDATAMRTGNSLLMYICIFHPLNHFLLIYIYKLLWMRLCDEVRCG